MRGKIILLDECSMIDRKTANDLFAVGCARLSLLAILDSCRRCKVRRSSITPTSRFRTIHRQALNSAVLRQAHAMRETGSVSARWRRFPGSAAGDRGADAGRRYDPVLAQRHAAPD